MFNFTSKALTWLSGSGELDSESVYGLKGIASISNVPGGRSLHAMVSHPSLNALHIFGGDSGQGYLNDLWMYDREIDQWTWLSGNSTENVPGAYGIKQIPSASNYPGGRTYHAMVTHSTLNLLYVFGGYGYDSLAESGKYWLDY
jgi:hypothetical protein